MTDLIIRNMDDLGRMSKMFASSGLITAYKSPQAIGTAIMAGRELGLSPYRSLQALHIIKGRPCMSGNLIASMVKGSEKYDYRVKQSDSNGCILEFFEFVDGAKESLGTSAFTMEDAQRAKLTGSDNWKKYPQAMLFNRCVSQGVRLHCPDVFNTPVYTPEEINPNIQVDENGEAAPVVAGPGVKLRDAAAEPVEPPAKPVEVEVMPPVEVDGARKKLMDDSNRYVAVIGKDAAISILGDMFGTGSRNDLTTDQLRQYVGKLKLTADAVIT